MAEEAGVVSRHINLDGFTLGDLERIPQPAVVAVLAESLGLADRDPDYTVAVFQNYV